MRRLSLTLLAFAFVFVFGAGAAVADDEVKKDAKKAAQETKEIAKEGAQEVKEGAQAVKREVKRDVHGAVHKATGTVKSVSATGFVLIDEEGRELAFEVDKGTVVRAKGASHKMSRLKADGTPTEITQFLSPDQRVSVRYAKPDDRLVAKDVKVKP